MSGWTGHYRYNGCFKTFSEQTWQLGYDFREDISDKAYCKNREGSLNIILGHKGQLTHNGRRDLAFQI